MSTSSLSIFFCSAKCILFFSPKYTVIFSISLSHKKGSYLLMIVVKYYPKAHLGSPVLLVWVTALHFVLQRESEISFVSSCEPLSNLLVLELLYALKLVPYFCLVGHCLPCRARLLHIFQLRPSLLGVLYCHYASGLSRVTMYQTQPCHISNTSWQRVLK